MFYIYIIYSEKSDKYSVGHSDNPERRLKEHNTIPFSTYTSKHRPWVLKASIPISEERGAALKVERYIKKQKSRKFIEELIAYQNDSERIAQLLACAK